MEDFHQETVWAVSAERIEVYLEALPCLRETGAGAYEGDGVRVAVTALPPRSLAGMPIPQTRVQISGGGEAREFERTFTLQFISAGG